ncbi:hypothetical protein [Halalkalicoccus subterraneus]|uniref:hypothetical protein n=1 Tax=Halalkalicoccus subterraneus TaxID=2675002 RepID=UPI000EFC4547|nr:hypothetical protein [Halalkalicoccus subterraneus]
MDRRTIVIVGILLAVLIPMWFIGLQGEPPSEEIEIDHSVSELRPLDGIVDTPNKLSPSQVGVIVWVALFGLVGVTAFFHRFMDQAARPTAETDTIITDGSGFMAPWIETEDRWITAYHPSSDAIEGLIAMGGLTVLTIIFAALFMGEYLTLARTQYFGLYAFGMFMSLTGLTVSYYAWFMPHVEVAERRDH